MTNPTNEFCLTCRFAVADGMVTSDRLWDDMIECHRHAPRPMQRTKYGAEDTATEWDWPILPTDGWCGEYQPGKPKLPIKVTDFKALNPNYEDGN